MRKKLNAFLRRFERDDTAATVIEYSMVIGLVSMIIVGIVTSMDVPLNDIVDNVGNLLNSNS